ncbi:bifunctional DNA primase/polymerase [Nocardiopsis suaedae]|uniref:Bifunctional DNA primase/polymerase n=1 Tax=Nocardiopsis suaedae TaxID=3018444 RepID=A0ABT4TIE2_9ACTN|nr:bifunctional DNA primase/polymerase [Nocardiopsis suaedae]MDA2804467.1 bifunctional DNA primase/polymerase [Nocardiopsis suaedae]
MPGFDPVDYPLAAARRGWHVFPLAPGTKNRQLVKWSRTATTDPGTVRTWWARWPDANYGIATGPSGLVVIDLDTPDPGEHPPEPWRRPGITDGADVLAALAEHAGADTGELLGTFTVATASGGTHLYYTAPPGQQLGNTAGDRGRGLGWLIDTRAVGGYVVGPGSTTRTGAYRATSPPGTPVAPLPAWIAEHLKPPPTASADAVLADVATADRRRTAYATAALRGEAAKVARAVCGERNTSLYVAAVSLGQLAAKGLLEPGEITAVLTRAAQAAGAAGGAPDSPSQIAATIRSGLTKGLQIPRRTRQGAI